MFSVVFRVPKKNERQKHGRVLFSKRNTYFLPFLVNEKKIYKVVKRYPWSTIFTCTCTFVDICVTNTLLCSKSTPTLNSSFSIMLYFFFKAIVNSWYLISS